MIVNGLIVADKFFQYWDHCDDIRYSRVIENQVAPLQLREKPLKNSIFTPRYPTSLGYLRRTHRGKAVFRLI